MAGVIYSRTRVKTTMLLISKAAGVLANHSPDWRLAVLEKQVDPFFDLVSKFVCERSHTFLRPEISMARLAERTRLLVANS